MSDTSLYEKRSGSAQTASNPRQAPERRDRIVTRQLAEPFSSSRSLASLPFDVLLNIAELLGVQEIYTLAQSCKTLQDFTRSRSIWLKLAANMLDMCQPLPVEGFQRLWELSTTDLARVVKHGHHIQNSWTNRSPQLVLPYKAINAPKSDDIVWLSPITSKYTLCCTKAGKVMCWDVSIGDCVANWKCGEDWEIWKCRVEFDERVVYFAMAKRVPVGFGTDCQLMALNFPAEVNGLLPSKPTFEQLSYFCFPGHVISVYLLDPLGRILSAYIWIESTNTLGLYVLLDWKVPIYVFLDTGISCEPIREWSCLGYDPNNVVIHAEAKDKAFQFYYPFTLLRSISSTHPPLSTPMCIPPVDNMEINFFQTHPKYANYFFQNAHFVRQWWPTLPHAEGIRRRSCTIILLTFRVPEEPPEGSEPSSYAPGTQLYTIAQHYFSIPLQEEQLRWWYIREPFEIVVFPHILPPAVGANPLDQPAEADNDNPGPALGQDAGAEGEPMPAPEADEVLVEAQTNMPLIAVDFGCAVWLEYVAAGSDQKRLRFVTFPPVDVDRSSPNFQCLSENEEVRTLRVPPEVNLSLVCHIGIDQAQGAIILGLTTGKVFIMRYE